LIGDALPPADCEAIRQVIYRYCRGIDRADRDILESCYWPDAIDDHGVAACSAAEFIDICLAAVQHMVTVHMIGNVLIEDGGHDTALVESYFHATHRLPDADGSGEREWTLLGRYLDRFEPRDGQWRIISRVVAVDHERSVTATLPTSQFVPRAEVIGGK
jgi:SnoaL-like domain